MVISYIIMKGYCMHYLHLNSAENFINIFTMSMERCHCNFKTRGLIDYYWLIITPNCDGLYNISLFGREWLTFHRFRTLFNLCCYYNNSRFAFISFIGNNYTGTELSLAIPSPQGLSDFLIIREFYLHYFQG